MFAGFSGLVLIMSFFFVPESKFERPLLAYQGLTNHPSDKLAPLDGSDAEQGSIERQMTIHSPRNIDTVNFAPRTFASGLRIFVVKPDWAEFYNCLKHMVQVFFFPNVTWVTVMNGIFLVINIALGLTYGSILSTAPYNWADKYISVAQSGQLVVAFIAIPVLGYGSDFLVKWMARRNNGIHEPEFRLLTLVVPLLMGILFAVIYGQAAQYPDKYHWMAIVFPLNGYYLAFIGANTAGFTYLLDSYPTRAGPVLVVICAIRGVISFGLSYGAVSLYDQLGYANAFGLFGGLTALFGALGVIIYVTGKRIRAFCARWTMTEDDERPHMG